MQIDETFVKIPNVDDYYITKDGIVLSTKRPNIYPNGQVLKQKHLIKYGI